VRLSGATFAAVAFAPAHRVIRGKIQANILRHNLICTAAFYHQETRRSSQAKRQAREGSAEDAGVGGRLVTEKQQKHCYNEQK
jgi:hypothetical protein